MKKLNFSLLLFVFVFLVSCRTDEYIIREEQENLAQPENTAIKGFYLLNEGNMGTNKATLDFFDYTTGTYRRNIYGEINPTVIKELGDVGNDIQIYGGKMYAVINVSNKIEVLDAKTVKRIKTIQLENCRYITFKNGKAYASSYAGPVSLDPNAPLGKVAEIDTVSLSIQREVTVGYQPEEMEIIGNQLFVANSGGYKYPNYDRTVSVVDLTVISPSLGIFKSRVFY